MDIQRQKDKKSWLKTHWYTIPLTLFAVLVVGYVWMQESAAYSAEEQNLAIGIVRQGSFEVSVRGTGTLTSNEVRWLAANVSGRVEVIHVKQGAKVIPGDMILQMTNPELVQQAEEIAWEIEALEAENLALKVSLESQVLDQEALVMNAKMNFESAKINLDAQEKLQLTGNATVSKIEYQRSMLETEQFMARWHIEQQRLEKLKESKMAQIEASRARYHRLQKSYARAQQQVASLDVRASIEGVLQVMPLEAGQQVNMGDNIAKLARQNELIAELQIPERQVNGVAIGQSVTIDTRRSIVTGTVIRIDPAVVNGVVQVDVAFSESLPTEARPDLTVDGTISLASIENSVFVGRPSYSQSDSTSSIYRLTSDGKFAERIPVTFGIGSASEIQILTGLEPGERIILSDSSAWNHLERIRIQ